MAQQIQIRRDTSTNWSSSNPILAQGELGLELNTGRLKVGDGITAWNSLPYYAPNLTSLGGVSILSLASGQVLIANASSVFENKSLSSLVNEYVSFSSLGSLAVINQLSYGSILNTPSLGSLAVLNDLSYTSLLNLPSLGSLAVLNDLSYTSLLNLPSLGSLAVLDSLSFTSLTNQPSLSSLAYQSTIDYTSAQLTNKPSLGSLAPLNAVTQAYLPSTASFDNLFVNGIQANSTASLNQIRSTGFITGTATMTELNSGVYNLYETGVQKAIFDGTFGGRFRANASGETFLFENYRTFQLTDNTGQYMMNFDNVNMQFNNRDFYFNGGTMFFGTANATTITTNSLTATILNASQASIGYIDNVNTSNIQSGAGYISSLNVDTANASTINVDTMYGLYIGMFGGTASSAIKIDGPDISYNRIHINNASTAVTGWGGYVFTVNDAYSGGYYRNQVNADLGLWTQANGSNPRVIVKNDTGYIGISDTAPAGVLEVNQTSTTAAVPTMQLVQSDVSEEFINFSATAGAANALSTSAISTYYGKIRVGFNGVLRWLPVYN